MDYEIFVDDDGKRIIVITEWGTNQKTEEEAIRFAANNYFKIKRDKLKCVPVYMSSKDADEIYFNKEKGTKKYFGILRK